MNIFTFIKALLGFTNYCPKHKIKYYIHGWDNLRGCEDCDEEDWGAV